jgi:hypothetical protein
MEIIVKDIEKLTKVVRAYKKVSSELIAMAESSLIDHVELAKVSSKCEKYRKQIELMIKDNFFFAVPYCGEKQWVLRKKGAKDVFVRLIKSENENSIVKFNGGYFSDVGLATKFNSKKEAEEFLPSLEYNIFREVLGVLSHKKEASNE